MSLLTRKNKPQPKLWLAIRLPLLPLNALGLIGDEAQPVAVIEKHRVVCVSVEAYAQGTRLGMDVTTAQLMSACETKARDSVREKELLKQLSSQMYEFTPYIETMIPGNVAEAGLLLEIASSLRLFKGLELTINLIQQSLEQTRYPFELGIAHTAKGAWLLSYHEHLIVSTDGVELFIDQLKTLPVQLLYEFPKAVESLEKTGFVTLGDIARQIDAQSISAMKKRFGAEFATHMSDIFGIDHDFYQAALFEKPAEVFVPEEIFSESVELEYPTNNIEFLRWPFEVLLKRLTQYLCKRQLECQRIEWTLNDIHHRKETLSVYCDTAQSQWGLFFKLTMIQVEARELSFEVDSITLMCLHTLKLQKTNHVLNFDDQQNKERYNADLTITLAKLAALLGEKSITKLSYHDSLLPEECNVEIPFNQTSNQHIPATYRHVLKPTWLLPNPAPIEIRKKGLYWYGYLTLLGSPRRIRAGWREQPALRDYYLARRQDDSRLWIYKDNHSREWFVHGVFV